jgi:hypothetical protein
MPPEFELPKQALQPSPALVLPRPDQVSPKRALLGVIMPVLGSLIATLDLQMTNASLKDIQGALGFSADEATWVSIAYTSAELAMIPAATLQTVLEGVYQPEHLPSQIIHPVHGRVLWMVDQAAASRLQNSKVISS